MTIENLTYLLKNPQSLTDEHLPKIDAILKEYPYFQSVRAIQLKGLYQKNSYKYNKALKITAAYTIDRTVLFNFITTTSFKQPITTISQEVEIDSQKDLNSDEKIENKINQPESEKSAKEILGIGKPISFSSNEPHTFNEWLQLSNFKRVDKSVKSTSQTDLINQFIESNPKIKPISKTKPTSDLAIESLNEDAQLMTETLAKVYLEQKKYKKAIQAYRILSLKYPEKSGFFANRIKAIKILQINKS
ncbi:MAG: hypothetical protein ACWA42_06295 [Lutibacter sp.]